MILLFARRLGSIVDLDLDNHPVQAVREVWGILHPESSRMWSLHAELKALDLPAPNEIDRIIEESDDPIVMKHRQAIAEAKQAARAYVLSTFPTPDPDDLWKRKALLGQIIKDVRRKVALLLKIADVYELPDLEEYFSKFKVPTIRSNQEREEQQEVKRPPTVTAIRVIKEEKVKTFNKLAFAAIHIGISIPKLVAEWEAQGSSFIVNGCEVEVEGS